MFLSKVIHIKILYETLHPEHGRGHQTDGAAQDRGETQGRRRRATITRVSTPRVLSNQSNGCKESSGDVKNHTLLNTNPDGYNDSLQAIFIFINKNGLYRPFLFLTTSGGCSVILFERISLKQLSKWTLKIFTVFYYNSIWSIPLQQATGTYSQVVDLEDTVTLNKLLRKI